MAEQHFDVVIVGGHIAGLASAITLAEAGKRVHLLLRDETPRPTLSVPLLFPNSHALLVGLGLGTALAETAAPRHHRARLHLDGLTIDGRVGGEQGVQAIRAEQLAGMLLARAGDLPTLSIEHGATVRRMCWEGEQVVGVCGNHPGGAPATWSAPQLIVAESGASGLARTFDPAIGTLPTRRNGFCVAYFEGLTPADAPAIETFFAPTEGYSVQCFEADQGLTGIAMELDASHLPALLADHESHFTRLLLRIPALAARLATALRVTPVWAGPINQQPMAPLSGTGWILLRGTATVSAPLLGQELFLALHDAALAAEAILGSETPNGRVARFKAALESRRQREATFAAFAQALAVIPGQPIAAMHAVLRTVARDASLADRFMGILARESDPADFMHVEQVRPLAGLSGRLRLAWEDLTTSFRPAPNAQIIELSQPF